MKKLKYKIVTIRDQNGTERFIAKTKAWIGWRVLSEWEWFLFRTRSAAISAINDDAHERRASEWTVVSEEEIEV